MDSSGLIQIVLYLVLLTALTRILGEYMARVFRGGKTVATAVLGPHHRPVRPRRRDRQGRSAGPGRRRNRDKILTHARILREVWGPAHAHDTAYLRVYVNQLRQKLEADPGRPVLIVTEPGVGYRLRTGEER